jgi:membrane protein
VSPTAEKWLAIVRAVAAETLESDLPFVASGLAYYSLMAVTPALVAGFLLLGELGGQALAERVVANTADVLSPDGQRFIRESMAQMSARSGVSVIALALSLWGARRLYRGLDQGVRKIYEVDGHSVEGVRDAARVLVLGGLGTTGIVGVAVAASLYADGGLLRLVAVPFTFVIALAVTYPILNGMAPGLGRVESLPGSLFTAVTWTVGAGVVGLTASGQVRQGALYGVLGGLLLLLTWFYAANFLLLLGFVVDAVCSRRAVIRSAGEPE